MNGNRGRNATGAIGPDRWVEGESMYHEIIQIMDAAHGSPGSKDFYEDALAQMAGAMDFNCYCLVLHDGDMWRIALQRGLPDHIVEAIEGNRDMFSGMFDAVLDGDRLIVTNDAQNDDYFPRPFRESLGYDSVVWVPLNQFGETVGFLTMGRRGRSDWSAEELGWIQSIGKLCGILLHQAYVFQRAYEAAVQAEREHVEAEMRDRIFRALGSSYVQEQAAEAQAQQEAGKPRNAAAQTLDQKFESLTETQKDVLRQVAAGESNKSISRALLMSESAVKKHLTAIYDKLGVHNRTEAAISAMRIADRL